MDKLMTLSEIYAYLCWYDPRHPDYDLRAGEGIGRSGDCFCDNCFRGRDLLAREILLLRRLLLGEEN